MTDAGTPAVPHPPQLPKLATGARWWPWLKGELRINLASEFPLALSCPAPLGRTRPARNRAEYGRQPPGKSVFVVRQWKPRRGRSPWGQTLISGDDRPELEEGEFHLLDLVGWRPGSAATAKRSAA